MALVPLEVLLDRLYDDCPVCAGSAKPGWVCSEHPDTPWPHDDCAAPAMVCTCDPFGCDSGAEACPGRRLVAGEQRAAQGTRLH